MISSIAMIINRRNEGLDDLQQYSRENLGCEVWSPSFRVDIGQYPMDSNEESFHESIHWKLSWYSSL